MKAIANEYKWLDREKARIALDKVVTYLEENDIKYWLDFGTLLGYYREKDFIVYDFDVDMGTNYEGICKLQDLRVKNAIDNHERELIFGIWTAGPDNLPINMSVAHLNIKLDIYCWFVNGDKDVAVAGYNKEVGKYSCVQVPKHYHENLKKDMFLGREYVVPQDTEGYIREIYGETWDKRIKQGPSKRIRLDVNQIAEQEVLQGELV
jgi:hypothetical protein